MVARNGYLVCWTDENGFLHNTTLRGLTVAEVWEVADAHADLLGTRAVSAGWYPAPPRASVGNADRNANRNAPA